MFMATRQAARLRLPAATRISPVIARRGMVTEKGHPHDDLGGPGGSEPITPNMLFRRRRNQTFAAVAVAAVAMFWLATRPRPSKKDAARQRDDTAAASVGLTTPGDTKAARREFGESRK